MAPSPQQSRRWTVVEIPAAVNHRRPTFFMEEQQHREHHTAKLSVRSPTALATKPESPSG
jgi:hypothetical protein